MTLAASSVTTADLAGTSVSVITPVYNGAGLIERAVRSVAAQDFHAIEHWVIDDGSTDQTPSVIARLAEQYPWLRPVYLERSGAAAARNAGIKRAQGRYIAFLDADDQWRPDKLVRQLGFMEQTKTAFSYGDYDCVNEDESATIRRVRSPARLDYGGFLKGCPIGCLTVAYNQDKLGKRFMPEVGRGHDWGLWLDLTRDGTVARRYPGTEAVYHLRRGSLSKRKLRKARDIYSLYRRQENLGRLQSLAYLAVHSVNSFR